MAYLDISRGTRRENSARAVLPLSFLAAALALLLFAWLANEVLEAETIHFDNLVRSAVHAWASPRFTTFMQFITWIGSSTFLVPFITICVAVFLYARWKRAALLLLITAAGALALDAVLKATFHRSRPVPFFGVPAPQSYSFPSGHALFSFCIFGVLAAVIAARVPSTSLRVLVWTVAAVLVILIGLSRIYLGVHYPTDVIAGYLAAAIWVSSIAAVDHWRRGRSQSKLAAR